MGIFSRLLKSSEKKDKSYVRAWAEKRQYEFHNSRAISSMELFAAMMYGLSSFGKKDASNTHSEHKGLGIDANEQFSGDGALFELGCYMYFCIDLWLFQNESDRREKILNTLVHKFIELFNQALGSNNLSVLFEQRLSSFGQLVRNGADAEKYHYHLSQLILRTKDNQHPKAYNFDNAPLVITGVFEETGVKVALISWQEAMLPAIIESLKNYCDFTK